MCFCSSLELLLKVWEQTSKFEVHLVFKVVLAGNSLVPTNTRYRHLHGSYTHQSQGSQEVLNLNLHLPQIKIKLWIKLQ